MKKTEEKSTNPKRSDIWNSIHEIVKTLPRLKVSVDAPDCNSVTTSIEELFLKSLPIQDSEEQTKAFNDLYDLAWNLAQDNNDYTRITKIRDNFQ